VKKHWIAGVAEVNKELLLILSIVMSAGLINLLIAGQRMALTIYNLPTLFAAYYFGRRRAVEAYPASHRARKRN
jgi:glucose-6-phosphate-specific signal transduction histidine kinase